MIKYKLKDYISRGKFFYKASLIEHYRSYILKSINRIFSLPEFENIFKKNLFCFKVCFYMPMEHICKLAPALC